MLYRLIALIKKELLSLLREKQTRVILIMPVIIQVLIFPFAATLEVTNATIAIYNQDNGQNSIELIQRIAKTKAFNQVLLAKNLNELHQVINEQKALLAIHFPTDFSANLATRQPTKLQVILDGRHSNSAQIAASYVQQVVNQYQQELAPMQLNSQLVIRNWFNPNLDYRWFVVPSLVALITTISIMIVTSLSVAREREQGTLEQLLVSPLTTQQIFIGKAVPALIVSAFQATIVLLAGIFGYKIPFSGSLVLFYFCMLFYGLSIVGCGLLISALCSTQQQAFIGVLVFMMPMILLSGYISPVENMPVWLQYFTWLNPIRHFTDITKMIYLKDAPFTVVKESLIALFFITLFTSTTAFTIFRKRIS